MRKALWFTLPFLLTVFFVKPFDAELQAPKDKAPPPAVDLYGDPLPPGVVQRLGTARWRVERPSKLAIGLKGQVLISTGGNGVTLFETDTGKFLHHFPGKHTGNLAVSGNGEVVLTDQLELIDLSGRKVVRRLGPRPERISALALSHDGKIAAIGEQLTKKPAKIYLWETNTGKELGTLEGHSGVVTNLGFSENGSLISAGSDQTVRSWDVTNSKELQNLNRKNKGLMATAITPNGKLVAILGYGEIELFSTENLKPIRLLKENQNERIFLLDNVMFSANGTYLVGASIPEGTYVWDVGQGQLISKIEGLSRAFAISQDEKVLYRCLDRIKTGILHSSAIIQWDIRQGKEIEPPEGHVAAIRSVVFESANILVSKGDDGKTLEWHSQTGKLVRQRIEKFILPAEHPDSWGIVARSPDGRTLALSAWLKQEKHGALKLWDGAAGKHLHMLLPQNLEGAPSASFSSDGKYVSSFNTKVGFRLWDAASGKELYHIKDVRYSAYSPDSKRLLLGGPGKTVSILDIDSGAFLQKWDTRYENPRWLTFSPDGRLVACAELDETWVKEIKTGKELFRLRANTMGLYFSPTGRILAVDQRLYLRLKNGEIEQPRAIDLCDTISGETVRRMIKPHGEHGTLAFSPDGRLLASGGGDSTILLWDMTDHAIAGELGKYRQPEKLIDAELNALWTDLAGDAAKAEMAIWTFAFGGKDGLAFLDERMRPRSPADANEVAKLIKGLDSPTFNERQNAAQALEKLAETAEAFVRKHLEGKITLESRQRLQQFLDKRDKDALRKLRAIEAVEQIDLPQAQELLRMLEKGAPNPRVAQASSAALTRLEKRK